ncbi:MAG: putative aspartate aminotransferase 2 [Methanocella sp. PtaU1.Bin125]|nr:MAG: putative aspartate aminotransferase 2 [Methanocella sp. PtaU1.Bin125]
MSRLDQVEESATLRLADLTNELKRQGKDILGFNLGEPDFNTPSHIIEAAEKALDTGKTHYAPSPGIPELREAIAEKLRKDNGLDVKGKEVIVTPGAKQAIFAACFSLINKGDEAILFAPSWVSYDACIKMSEGKTVWVKSNEDGSVPAGFVDHVTKKTKLIIINSPNNPSGAVLSKKDLQAIADVAKDRGIYVLSDEIYEKIIYSTKHYSIGTMIPERTITVNGFSKAYAMAGWRIGYVTGPKAVYDNMLKVQQHTISSPTTFVQYGAAAALTGSQVPVAEMVKQFHARRDVVVKGLRDMGLHCEMPEGAFYAWPKVEGDSEKICEELLGYGVSLTPGSAFGPGCNDHIRMSYASSMDQIKEGLARMKNYFSR